MPLFTFHEQNVAAGGTYEPLTGWQYERLPFPALVELAYESDELGFRVTVTSGSDTLAEEQPVSGGGTDGVLPAFDQPMLEDIAAAGDKIKIRFRETQASGTGDIMGWVRITQIG